VPIPGNNLERCVECHADTVTEGGSIVFEEVDGVRTTKHINGEVDFVVP
jgi:hypothetical protein